MDGHIHYQPEGNAWIKIISRFESLKGEQLFLKVKERQKWCDENTRGSSLCSQKTSQVP